MAITLSYNGTVQAVDSVQGSIALQKVLTNLSTTGTYYIDAQAAQFGTTPTSVPLPTSPVNFLYFKNTHATQTITVTWTPNGGASNVVLTLQPGAFIGFAEPSGSNGISALSITASGANTTCEFILGG